MHVSSNLVTRVRWATGSLAALLVSGALVSPAAAQPAQDQAPVAMPRPAATQTAPATASAEEVLWNQILALRQLPKAPAGTTQPFENPGFVKVLNEQLEKSLDATNDYLKKYPKGEHLEEVQIQRLDTMRMLAVVNKKPLDAFQAEAQQVLKGDASTNVKAAVEYMLMGIEMENLGKQLMENQQASMEQKEQMWRQAVVERATRFIEKYPKTTFAERFYILLIDASLQDGNFAKAQQLLGQMRQDFPESPAIAEISNYIQQAAATQSAATQPGAATRPAAPAAPAPAPARE